MGHGVGRERPALDASVEHDDALAHFRMDGIGRQMELAQQHAIDVFDDLRISSEEGSQEVDARNDGGVVTVTVDVVCVYPGAVAVRIDTPGTSPCTLKYT